MARGRWLRKVGRLADHALDEIRDDITLQASSVTQLASHGKQVAALSRETVQICDETATQRQRMVDVGAEILATLQQLTTLSNPEDAAKVLETIRELTSGDTLREATQVATGLSQAARNCVDKSLRIVELLEQSVDCLPGPIQKLLLGSDEDDDDDDNDKDDNNEDDINEDDKDDSTSLVKNLDRDVHEVQTCIEAIQNLNLTTAFTVGVQAFQQIAGKVHRAQALFDKLRQFAVEITEVAHAMEAWNPREVVRQSRDLVQCLRWTDELRDTAQAAAKLMPVVIDLFRATADRISILWAALAHAKDCLLDCVERVRHTQKMCVDAQQKSLSLMEQSLHVKERLEQILQSPVSKESVTAVRSLGGGEIQQAIDLATHMDDIIVACSQEVVAMIERVQEGYNTMPPILTQGVDVTAAGTGRSQGDPEPANVEADLNELEKSRGALEEAKFWTAAQAGVHAFAGISSKASVGTDLLQLVEQFATDCQGTIESFLTVWDLPSAGKKIAELCHLVNLGTAMKQFADQIQRLLVAMVTLMKAAIAKFKKLDIGDIGESLGDLKEHVQDNLEQKVDDLKDKMQDKLQFWKK